MKTPGMVYMLKDMLGSFGGGIDGQWFGCFRLRGLDIMDDASSGINDTIGQSKITPEMVWALK